MLIDKISPRFNDLAGRHVEVHQRGGFGQGGVPFIKRVIGLPGDTVSLENGPVCVTTAGGRGRCASMGSRISCAIDGDAAPTLPRRRPGGSISWTIAAGSHFVMGDNRPGSQDSRLFGPVHRG